MSSPEVVRFDITNEDYANEFNQRTGFRQSKNQATYGIWADEDSDEELPQHGGSRKQTKDYKAPMNFISGGIKVGSAPADEDEPETELDITDSEEEEEFKEKRKAAEKKSTNKMSSTNGFSGGKVTATGKAVGDWEKHTKGIGQKLLEKMGHIPGRGLGKTLQGISAPVEAFKRSGKAALGFYGNEHSEQSRRDFKADEPTSDLEAEEADFKAKLGQWRTDVGSKEQKKAKYVYKTADDLLSGGRVMRRGRVSRQSDNDIQKVKVIDMTGKHEKILSGYHAIGHKNSMMSTDKFSEQADIAFDLPELIHNLELLIDITEEDLIQNNKKHNHEQDMRVNLQHESERLNNLCVRESTKIQRLQEIIDLVGELEDNCEDARADLKLQNVVAVSNRFESNYGPEYHQFRLNTIGQSIGIPLLRAAMKGWNALYEPRRNLQLVQQWQGIMNAGEDLSEDSLRHQTPLSSLLWTHWYPCIRSAASVWNTREPGQMCDLLENWLKPDRVIPTWIRAAILDQLIMPRLTGAVDAWDPLTDTVPIHQWLHPWLSIARDRLDPLYQPIRHKLARALRNWDPTDPSAKLIIQPWVGVFKPDHMNAFLVTHIMPKLVQALQKFIINPHNQDLDPWYGVVSWEGLIARHHMLHLLLTNFFPKWLHTLSLWLSDQPNYQEITKWYSGWKSVMPSDIAEEKTIKEKFTKALEIMNQALSGKQVNTEMSNFYKQAPPPPAQFAARRPVAPRPASVSLSFREMVQRRAEQCGLLFVPIANRTQFAKQVYKLGHAVVYFDNNVVFVRDEASGQNVWVPTSLEQLIQTLV